jgi:eukaryotic-like serine/threonine-protein kinase
LTRTLPLQGDFGDRYRIVRELGSGGMATVYLARDLKHERDVALKVLRPELAAILGTERFFREIEFIARLTHPHILPLYDSGLTPLSKATDPIAIPWYTMPYVEGETLRARLKRESQLPLDDALQIAREVADALNYAHGHDIVHRDIKPENILLEAGHAVVADFGIAKAINAAAKPGLSSASLPIGTPPYMSPEQVTAEHTLDGRSDLYSLGCVLYEMLAGRPPFTGATTESIARQHIAAPVPSVRVVRPSVPVHVEQAITRALAKAPADRFATASELARALERGVRPPSIVIRRWRVPALGMIAVMALLALWLLLRRPGERAADLVKQQESPRIAVLYFDVLPRDSTLAPFAEGLTEALIRELGGARPFRVVSRNGVRSFRSRTVPFDSLVAALGVNTVIDGSVRRVGSRLQVQVQLIDARSNTNIDTLSLEGPSPRRPGIEQDVAQRLAASVRRELGRTLQLRMAIAGTTSARARDFVLKARRARDDAAVLAATPYPEDLSTAIESLRGADSLLALAQAADPPWVRPMIERGWVQHDLAQLASGQEAPALEDGIRFAEQALRRAPEDPLALELHGTLLWERVRERQGGPADSSRLREAEADLRAALDRDSTLAGAWATLSLVLWFRGRTAEAEIAARRALEEDAYLAHAKDVFEQLFFSDLMLGDFAQAGKWCRRAQLYYPADWRFLECELTLMRHNTAAPPAPDSAWALVRELDRLDPPDKALAEGRAYHSIYRRVVAATISARAGNPALARVELARARRLTAGDSTLRLDLAIDEAYLRMVLGERERAAELLRQYIEARPMARQYIARDPLFSALRLH